MANGGGGHCKLMPAIHLKPGHRKDLKSSQMAKGGHDKLIAAIHLTPGHRKDLRALTNGKWGAW
jgi:hypothetical protein